MVITKTGFSNKCFIKRDDSLLVKIKSISDVYVLVKQVLDFAMLGK